VKGSKYSNSSTKEVDTGGPRGLLASQSSKTRALGSARDDISKSKVEGHESQLWCKALAALPEGTGSIPSTHGGSQPSINSTPSSGLCGYCMHIVHRHICRQKKKKSIHKLKLSCSLLLPSSPLSLLSPLPSPLPSFHAHGPPLLFPSSTLFSLNLSTWGKKKKN